jgi:hypothetical protein
MSKLSERLRKLIEPSNAEVAAAERARQIAEEKARKAKEVGLKQIIAENSEIALGRRSKLRACLRELRQVIADNPILPDVDTSQYDPLDPAQDDRLAAEFARVAANNERSLGVRVEAGKRAHMLRALYRQSQSHSRALLAAGLSVVDREQIDRMIPKHAEQHLRDRFPPGGHALEYVADAAERGALALEGIDHVLAALDLPAPEAKRPDEIDAVMRRMSGPGECDKTIDQRWDMIVTDDDRAELAHQRHRVEQGRTPRKAGS